MYRQKVDQNKEQVFYDRYNNSMVNGEYHERIFRNISGLSYNKSHSTVADRDGRFLYSDDFYRGRRIYTDAGWLRRYHYGCLRPYGAHVARQLYYGKRDDAKFAEKTSTPEKLQAYSEAMGYFHWLKDGDKALDKPNLHFQVDTFRGEHPSSIKSHPRYGCSMSDFGQLPFPCHWENKGE